MLCLFTRFVFVICVLMVPAVTCADPPEVRLTPRDEYERIPTRREMERAKAAEAESTTHAKPDDQILSILESVQMGERLSEQNTSAPELLQSESIPEIRQTPMLQSLEPREDVALQNSVAYSSIEAMGTYGHYPGPSELDLREFLPIPNKQQKQNCVAWALGYASYSCQICQERKSEKPVHDHDLFSPSYIYNKLNHDPQRGTIRDDGLIVTEAIQFILKHGCATAKTMPLFERTLPTAAAESEAKVYRAFGHQKAEDYLDIRAYLQEGYPVILVIRNSPEFKKNEPLCKPYRWQRTDKEMQNLEPHAVCAVGYDDEKQAILVMNSYGDRWKDNGFCWVAYDTLRTIPADRTDDMEVWCLEAHVVMVKNNNPVVSMSYPATRTNYSFGGFYRSRPTIKVSFVLHDDGMIYAADARVSPDVSQLPQWHLEDLTGNDETIFVLRQDQLVARLNNDDDVVTARQRSAIWAHLTLGVPKGSKIKMIAAAKSTPLFALTDRGELIYIPSGSSHWQDMNVDGVSKGEFVDLRDNQSKGPVSLTTNDGRVFTFQAGERWVLRTK